MKTSGWVVAVLLAAGGLALQGCASNGGINYAPGAEPSAQRSNSGSSDKAIVQADTKENFEAIVAAIHKQMAPGGRWQFVNKGERATIDGSFDDMSELYKQYGSVDKMNPAAKARLLADQNTVNAVLTKKDGERLICKNEVPVGSHLPVRTCRTYAQIELERQRTQSDMMRLNQQAGEQRVNGH